MHPSSANTRAPTWLSEQVREVASPRWRQAAARGHSLTREVALLASHGLTHLVGFDHPHAEGLGFEEGAAGPEWQVFHDAWAAARAALPADV